MDDFERAIDNSRIVINLVKSRPELYDPNHEDYTNRFAHTKAWKELSAKLSVSVLDFKAKWASLRNSYARSIRALQDNPTKPRTKWYLEDSMSFIKDHIQRKSKRRCTFGSFAIENELADHNNLANDDIKTHSDSGDEPTQSSFPGPSALVSELHSELKINDVINGSDVKLISSDIHEHKIKRRRKRSSSSGLDGLLQSINSFFNVHSAQLQLSADDLFFQSIQKDFEKLSDKKKRRFKALTLNSINDLLDEPPEQN